MPWSGVLAEIEINSNEIKWNFAAHISINKPKPVTEQILDFYNDTGKKASLAWNGGYILNPELVGKLGLSQKFIGSPLGLLIINKKVIRSLFSLERDFQVLWIDAIIGLKWQVTKPSFNFTGNGICGNCFSVLSFDLCLNRLLA